MPSVFSSTPESDFKTSDDVDNLLDGIYNLVKQNIIFEGTVAQIVNLKLGGGVLTVPQALTGDIELWLSDGSKKFRRKRR